MFLFLCFQVKMNWFVLLLPISIVSRMSFEDLTRQLSECRTIVKAHDQSFNVRRKRILGTYFSKTGEKVFQYSTVHCIKGEVDCYLHPLHTYNPDTSKQLWWLSKIQGNSCQIQLRLFYKGYWFSIICWPIQKKVPNVLNFLLLRFISPVSPCSHLYEGLVQHTCQRSVVPLNHHLLPRLCRLYILLRGRICLWWEVDMSMVEVVCDCVRFWLMGCWNLWQRV